MSMHNQNKLRKLLEGEEERRRRRKEAIRDALAAATIPVPDEVRDEVATLFVTDALEVLRAHRGFDIENRISSIRTAVQLFDQAFADLTAALDAFDAFSRRPEFGYRSHRDELNILEVRIRKEIFVYSELGHSLQDHCRRLRAKWAHPDLKEQIARNFRDDGLHDFVCGLRTALHHLQMVEANWLIRDSGRAATSHYVFSRDELRAANPEWNLRARGYLDSCSDEIDVKEIAQAYYSRVQAFYGWLLRETEIKPPPEVADYRRCWNVHRQCSARMHWRLFLTEFLKRKVDPYVYLERYLTPNDLERAMRLPLHSREQADFIISVVDEYSTCDDEIRALVYRLFGVLDEA